MRAISRWGRWIEGRVTHFVHPLARRNKLTALKHRAFIFFHFLGGIFGLVGAAIYIPLVGANPLLALVIWTLLVMPLAIALFLSSTGRLATAHIFSSFNLAGLITVFMYFTGGIQSYLAVWLAIVPMEAALSGRRHVIGIAVGISLFCLSLLLYLTMNGLVPAPHQVSVDPAFFALFGIVSAVLYGGGLAMSIERFHERSERIIRMSDQRSRLLNEYSTDMITRHDLDGRVVYVSAAARSLTGLDAHDLLGRGLFSRIIDEDRDAFQNAFYHCAHCEGGPISVTFRLKPEFRDENVSEDCSSDSFIWVEMRLQSIGQNTSGYGTRSGIVGVSRDISARKHQEARLKKALDVAEKANRAKAKFIANISHQLRTPLNSVIGFAQVLRQANTDQISETDHQQYVDFIHQGGLSLLEFVNSIIELTEIEGGTYEYEKEAIDVGALVATCGVVFEDKLASKSISLALHVEENIGVCLLDRRLCRKIFVNLLDNAVKFTPDGGKVSVDVRRDGDFLTVSIEDNGVGIAKADLSSVGQPFYQAVNGYAQENGGPGLGLALAKRLTEVQGGGLDIYSCAGSGTKVLIHLPVHDENAVSGKKGKVLQISSAA